MIFVLTVVVGGFAIWLYVKNCQERDRLIAEAEAFAKAKGRANLQIPTPPKPFYARKPKA